MKNLTKKNTIGTILGSVFITLLLVGVGGYFGLPALFPNLNENLGDYLQEEDLEDYTKTEDLTDEGILLQTKYFETNVGGTISHDDLVYEKINNLELNITTTGNSKLIVAFEGRFVLQLGSSFDGGTKYNITLDISGVGNRTTSIHYYMGAAYGSIIEISDNVHISFETEILPAGTYSISLLWKSLFIASPIYSNLYLLNEYPSSLYAQEIAV